jgi:hypothetical protein
MDITDLYQRAESGSVVAQSVLGLSYLYGMGVQVDYQEAFRFLSAAPKEGSPRAMAGLARMHLEGLGIPKNVPEALRLFGAAAEAGEFLAQVELARILSRGVDLAPDPEAALKWYSTALAQQGRVEDGEEMREARRYVEAHRKDKG